jgi:hypothetical protein
METQTMPQEHSLSSQSDDVKANITTVSGLLTQTQQKLEDEINDITENIRKRFSMKKDSRMTVHGWYFATLIAGLIPAVIGCILWTTLSPFDKGTDIFITFQKGKEYSRILSTTGTSIIVCLYMLDFFAAPHLNGNGLKKEETKKGVELVIDPSRVGSDDIPKQFKKRSIEFADNEYNAKYSEIIEEKFGFSSEEVRTLLPDDKYINHMDSLSKRKVHICIIGNKEINRPLTIIARVLFFIAILCACFYSLIGVDKYPNRPILLTLGLYPLLQWYVNMKLKLSPRSPAEAMFELEVAKMIKSTTDKQSVPHAKAQAVIMDVLTARNLIESDKYNYYRAVSMSTATVSFILLILFCIWTYVDPNYNWNPKTQEMLSDLGIEERNVQFAIWGGKIIILEF